MLGFVANEDGAGAMAAGALAAGALEAGALADGSPAAAMARPCTPTLGCRSQRPSSMKTSTSWLNGPALPMVTSHGISAEPPGGM